ncbi:MAG: outer membrane beta-barrel protein [Desulfobulbaceae bacterium]|nr:outer membrane beta-barrel protein [Desulfobulbaceae bacterium]
MKNALIRSTSILSLIFFAAPCISGARTNSLYGSVSVRQSYDSNVYRTDEDHEEGWTTILSPTIRLTSEGKSDSCSFSYSPGIRYNHRTDEDDLDHDLSLSVDKSLSSRVKVAIRDNFVETEESVQDEEAGIVLSEDRLDNRYWTNSFSARMEFEYAMDSMLVLAYANSILDNESAGQDDYIKHNPSVSVSYRFNPQWDGNLSYDYTKGNFTLSDDLKQHSSALKVGFQVTTNHKFSGEYSFSHTDFQGISDDYSIHGETLGWDWGIDQRTDLSVSVGVTHVSRDSGTDSSAFKYGLSVSREFKRGNISFSGNGGFDERYFEGAGEGLSRFRMLKGSLSYQLMENLSSDLYLSYRNDDDPDQIDDNEKDTYGAGVNLSYAFGRWYSISVDYSYRQVNADLDFDDYDDHRVVLAFTAGKELVRW